MRDYKLLFLFFTFLIVKQISAQVTAGFTMNNDEGCNSLNVVFTNTSSGSITNYDWYFGNGTEVHETQATNPIIAYNSPGVYTVTLTVSDGTNSDTYTNTVTVYNDPTASFTMPDYIGCLPFDATFNDNSTNGDGTITEWYWLYGDGFSSNDGTSNNSLHTYNQTGNYSPSLIVVDDNGCNDTLTLDDGITISQDPNIIFGASPTSYCQATDVNFTINTTGYGSITNSLDFGDGTPAIGGNGPFTHFYNIGEYDAILVSTDEYGCSSSDTIHISINQLQADILFDEPVCAGVPFYIENSSGTTSHWEFGDGGAAGGAVTFHTYNTPGTYTLTLQAGDEICSIEVSTEVVVNPSPTAEFTISPEFACEPSTFTFTNNSTGASIYDWSFGSSEENPSFDFDTEGSTPVTLIVENTFGCTSEITHYLTIDTPTVNITANPVRGCIPLDVDFTSFVSSQDPADTYSWDFQTGDLSSEANPTYTFSDTGEYVVELLVITELGCETTDTITIQAGMQHIPDFLILPGTVCIGDTLYYTNLSTHTNYIEEYNWSLGGSEFEPEDIVVPEDTGFYSLDLTVTHYGCDSMFTNDSAFYINGPIVRSVSYEIDCDFPFTPLATADLSYADSIFWSFGDGFTLDTVGFEVSYTYPANMAYWLVAEARNETTGCTHSDSIIVQIKDPIAQVVLPDTICSVYSFDMSSSQDGSTYYIDFGDGTNSDWTQSIINHTYLDSGLYYITAIVQDMHGCEDTLLDTTRVLFGEAGFIVSSDSVCYGSPFEFVDTSQIESPIIQYNWNISGNSANLANNDTLTHSLDSGSYFINLVVIDAEGCQYGTNQYPIHVQKPWPSFSVSDAKFCLYDTLKLDHSASTGNNISHYFEYGDGESGSDTNHIYATEGPYTIKYIVTDNLNCQDSITATIEVRDFNYQVSFVEDSSNCYPFLMEINNNYINTDATFSWTDTLGNNFIAPEPSFLYDRGTYVISVHGFLNDANFACELDTNLTLIVDGPFAEINMSKDIACINDSVVFWMTDTANIENFTWIYGDGTGDSDLDSTTHIFDYVPANGKFYIKVDVSTASCPDKFMLDSIDIYQVEALFSVDNVDPNALEDTVACSPLQVNFINSSLAANGSNNYSWQLSDGTIYSDSLLSTPHSFINTNQADSTFTIQLMIESPNGCKDTTERQVVVKYIPEINMIDNQFICWGDEVNLWATGGDSILWTSTANISDPNAYNTTSSPDSSTTYYVELLNSNCRVDSSVEVTVQQVPLLNVTPVDTVIIIGESFQYQAGTDQNDVSFIWTPSTGLDCSGCLNPFTTPAETVTYTVSIQDSAQCHTVSQDVHIEVLEKYSIDVPNTFTPNEDGENDIVYVKGWGILDLLEFRIFNRWGEEVFFSNDLNLGWDGTKGGKPQNVDTYAYIAKVMTYAGTEKVKKGTITLLR